MCISFICHLFLSKTGVGEKGREVTQQASPLVGPFLSSCPGLSRLLWSVERVRGSRLEGAGGSGGWAGPRCSRLALLFHPHLRLHPVALLSPVLLFPVSSVPWYYIIFLLESVPVLPGRGIVTL